MGGGESTVVEKLPILVIDEDDEFSEGFPTRAITADGTAIWQGPQSKHEGQMSYGIRLLRFTEDADLVQYRILLNQTAAGELTAPSQ
jgi:hypothetical protein